jgi:integrase/recombinase XerD
MPKLNREGQSAILTPYHVAKIRDTLKGPYQLIWDIANFTGERWGAILALKVIDCYEPNGSVREFITFKWHTRKQSAGKKAETRQVYCHPVLRLNLQDYSQPKDGFLFPSPVNPNNRISSQSADYALRQALNKLRLEFSGISTHSTRRTFITKLANSGANLHDIKALTGHKDMESLMRYIDSNPDTQKSLVMSL